VFKNLFSYCTSFQSFSDGHSKSNLPFMKLQAEAKARQESFLRRESAYHACKQQSILKRYN